jgi:hypothetical protein
MAKISTRKLAKRAKRPTQKVEPPERARTGDAAAMTEEEYQLLQADPVQYFYKAVPRVGRRGVMEHNRGQLWRASALAAGRQWALSNKFKFRWHWSHLTGEWDVSCWYRGEHLGSIAKIALNQTESDLHPSRGEDRDTAAWIEAELALGLMINIGFLEDAVQHLTIEDDPNEDDDIDFDS